MPTPPPLLNRAPNRTIPAQEPLDYVGAYQRALKARTSRNLETGNPATAEADAYREVNAIADLPMPAPPRPTSGLADVWDALKPQGNVQDRTWGQFARGVHPVGALLDIGTAIPELPRMLMHEAGYEPAIADTAMLTPDILKAWTSPALNYADPMNLGNNAPPEARAKAAAARAVLAQLGTGQKPTPALVAQALGISEDEAARRLAPWSGDFSGSFQRTPNRYPLEEQGTPEPPVMTLLRDAVGLVEGGAAEGALRVAHAALPGAAADLLPAPNPAGYLHGVADRIRSGNAVRGDIQHLYGKVGRTLTEGANEVASLPWRIPGAESVLGAAATDEERKAAADWAEQAAGAVGLGVGTLLEGKFLHSALKAPGKVSEAYGQHRAARTAAEANAAAQAAASAQARASGGPTVSPTVSPPPTAAAPPPVSPVRVPPPPPGPGGGPRPAPAPVRVPPPLPGGAPVRPPVDPAAIIERYPPPREFRPPTQMVNERRALAGHQPDLEPAARPPSLHQPDLEPAKLPGPWPTTFADPRLHMPDMMPGVPAPLPRPPRARWVEPPTGPGNVRLRGEPAPRAANPLLQGWMEDEPTRIRGETFDSMYRNVDRYDYGIAPSFNDTGVFVGDQVPPRTLVRKDPRAGSVGEVGASRLARVLNRVTGLPPDLSVQDIGAVALEHPVEGRATLTPFVPNEGTWGDTLAASGPQQVTRRPLLLDMAPEDITALQIDNLFRHLTLDADPNSNNYLVQRRPDGRPRLVPIDRDGAWHGMSRPGTMREIRTARNWPTPMEDALARPGGELLLPPSRNPGLRQWIERVQSIPDEQFRPIVEQEVRRFYEELEGMTDEHGRTTRPREGIHEYLDDENWGVEGQIEATVNEVLRRKSQLMQDAEDFFSDEHRRIQQARVDQANPELAQTTVKRVPPPDWARESVPWRPRIPMPELPARDATQLWAEGLDIRETPLTQQRGQVLQGPWPQVQDQGVPLPPAPTPVPPKVLPPPPPPPGPKPAHAEARGILPRRRARLIGPLPETVDPVGVPPRQPPFEVYREALTGETKEAYYFNDPQGNVKGPFRTPNKAAGEAEAARRAFLQTGEQTLWVEPGPPAPPKRPRGGGGRGGPKPPAAPPVEPAPTTGLPSEPPVAEAMEGPGTWEVFEREPGKFYWRAPDGTDIGSYIRLEDAQDVRDIARQRATAPAAPAAPAAPVTLPQMEVPSPPPRIVDPPGDPRPAVRAGGDPPPAPSAPTRRPLEPYEAMVTDARGKTHKRYFFQTLDGVVRQFSERKKRDNALALDRTSAEHRASRESGSATSPSDAPPPPGKKRRRDRRGAVGWAGRAAPAASPLQALLRGQVPEYIDRMALEAGRAMDQGMDPNALPANVQALLDSVSQEVYGMGFDELLVNTGRPHRAGSTAVQAQPLPPPPGGGPRPVALPPPPPDPMLPSTHPGRVVREAVRLASTQELPETVLQSLAGGAKVHRRTADEAQQVVRSTLSVERQDALLQGMPVQPGDLPALQQHIPHATPTAGMRLPGNAVQRAQLMREYQQAVLRDSLGELANPRYQVQGRPGPMKQLLKSAADVTVPGKRVRRPWVRAVLENPVSRYVAQLFEDPVAALPDRTRHVFEQFRSRQEQLQNEYAEQVKRYMRDNRSTLEDAQYEIAADWADHADLVTVGRAWVRSNLTARGIPPNKWADFLNPSNFSDAEAAIIGHEYLHNNPPTALNTLLRTQQGFDRPLRDRQWSEANATMAMEMGTSRNVRAFADAMFEEQGIVRPADRDLVTQVFEGRHATVGPHGGVQYLLPREDIVRAERILRNMGLEPGAFDPAIPLERISIDQDSVYVPEYQARAIENLKSSAGTQFSASRVPGIGGKVIDGYLRLWKSAATLTRPAYYLSQMVTSPYYVQLAEGVGTAAGATRNLLLSGRNSRVVSALMERADQMHLPRTALKAGEEYIRTKGGAVYHIDEFEQAARDQGLFEGRASLEQQVSLRRELVRHARMHGSNLLRKAQATPGYVTDLAREFSNAFDTNMRVSTMVELAVNQGLDPVEAASRAKKATLDFRAHNSSVDKDARLLFTWWSYLRANHDMHMRALLTHPERVIVPAMAGLRGWQNLGAGAPAMAREAMGGDEARPLSDIELAALSNQDLSRIPFYLDRNVTDWEGREDPRYAGWAVTTTPGMGIEWIGPFLAFKDAMAPAELADQRDFVGQFSPPIQVAIAGINPRSTAWANRVPEVMLSIPGFKERFGIDLYPLRPDDQPALADPSATAELTGRDGFWAAGEATADPNARAIHQRNWQMFKAGFSPFITSLDTGATLAGVSPPPPYMTTNEFRATWAAGGTPRPIYHEAEVGYQNKAERVKNLNNAADAAQLPERR